MSSILKVDTIQDANGNAIISSDGSGNLTPNTFTALTVSGDLTVDTDTLYVDSANNRVGIGTSSPSSTLEVIGSINSSDGGTQGIAIASSGFIEIARTNSDAYIDFKTSTSEDFDVRIQQASNGLRFDTGGDGSTSEAMRIDSSGNVGIGVSSPAAQLDIRQDGTGTLTKRVQANLDLSSGTNLLSTDPTLFVQQSGTGSAALVLKSGTVDFALRLDSSGNFIFDKDTTERMRIDGSGNVGIGTNSPSTALDVVGSVGASGAFSSDNGTTHTQISIAGTGEGVVGTASNHDLQIRVNASERMRIDTSGNVGINETSAEGRLHVAGSYTGTYGRAVGLFEDADLTGDTNNQILVLVFSGDNDAANATFVSFRDSGGEIGAINALSGGTTVQYITSSDYRLKENINYDFDATSRLKQLKPARFNFKTNTDRTLDGFLAHEVSDIVPEAVRGTKDETETKEKVVVNSSGQVIAENIEEADWENGKIADEDGNTKYPIDSTWEATKIVPVYQGIDQSKLVPLLTASLQEAIAKIEELETRLTALEA